ncbi:MAG: RelA/SpoT family protein [Candidatus Moranbacteria bacterium]|nr:RelA/SpoT family protein [Candidatus Moranbacteria bacterium]
MTIKEVIKAAKSKNPKLNEELIYKAFLFAKKAHQGQKRMSGEPYLQHPLETAHLLAKIGLGDDTTIAAGLLHDVPEDTKYSLKQVEKKFGKEIAFIVSGITKVGKIKLRGKKEEYDLENLRRMFLAMASDIRTVLIKLADRHHNMTTLYAKEPEKQYRIARETLEIMAPIANRLGMGELKGSLEDMAFKYVFPKKYKKTLELTREKYKQRKKAVNSAIKEINGILKKEKIKAIDIHGRAKHLYRLYLKLKRHDMNIDKIYDLVAIRIIVPQIRHCYETLGIIHKYYKPLIKRIKDYISLPKPNGYRSLHTTVFGPGRTLLEIQIRTPQMHEEAEFGIAAHWIYSTDKKFLDTLLKRDKKDQNLEKFKKIKSLKKELNWVKQLRSWQNSMNTDSQEFFESLKIDFFKDRIFACTPGGDVLDLPEGATPIDFAYAIHTEVGNSMIQAKAEGEPVSFDYNIQNGEVIEIITQKGKKTPNEKWLDFAKTGVAKSKIRQSLKKSKKINITY